MPLATEDVPPYIWESRFGDILIEVRSGNVFINGKHVAMVWELSGTAPP